MLVTIGTRKGGAGKSTITTNLASLRATKGHDVCIIDTDDQQSSAMWAATRAYAIQEEPGYEKVIYVPAVSVHERAAGTGGKGTLAAIAAQAGKYDDLIIDVPGRDAEELRSAIISSDIVAIPLRPSQFDLWAFKKDLEDISLAKSLKAGVGKTLRAIIFFNGISTSPIVKGQELARLEEFLNSDNIKPLIKQNEVEICTHHISVRGIYSKAIAQGLGVHETAEKTVSDENAVHEISMLYKFIFGGKK